MALKDGVVSYWKFDESSGNAADSVGSNTLTNINTATYNTGKINNSAYVTATSAQSFEIADASQSGLDITGDMTFAGWFYPTTDTSVSTDLIMVAKWKTGGQLAYQFRYTTVSGNKSLQYINSADGTTSGNFSLTKSLTLNAWQHVAVVYTAASPNANFYVNGVSSGNGAGTLKTSQKNGTDPFCIGDDGRHLGAGTCWDGRYDEIGIWNRTLSAAEISELYNGGTGLQYPFTGTARTLGLLGVGS